MNSLATYRTRPLSVTDSWDRLLDSFFSVEEWEGARTPSVDVREETDRYVLEADLPGTEEKDLDVKVEDHLLTISTNRETKKNEKRDGYIVRERGTRAYSRSFVLPKEVDREKIDATFANGVLTLEMAKSAASQPKRIEIRKK